MKLPRENIKYIIVHQTRTPRDRTTFELTKKYHINLGWGNIAYHYFIDANGRMRKGRNERTAGMHTKASGMNLKSIGVCVAGDFNKEKPTSAQLKTLEAILKNLASKYHLPKDRILGHREVEGAATECPGDNLLKRIEEFRTK